MTCTISDQLLILNPDGSSTGLRHGPWSATPDQLPFLQKVAGVFRELHDPGPAGTTEASGNLSLVLPWPSESSPATVNWQLALPDGTVWKGPIPEGVAGPLSLYTLKTTYAWTVASAPVTNLAGAVLLSPASQQTGSINLSGAGAFGGALTAASLVASGAGTFGDTISTNLPSGSSHDVFLGQVSGSTRFRVDAYGHLLSGGSLPASVAAAPGVPAGTAFAFYITPPASDTRGIVQVSTGASPPGAGQLCTVTFANPFPAQVIVFCVFTGSSTPASTVAYPYTASTTSFTIALAGAALLATTTYYINYVVFG